MQTGTRTTGVEDILRCERDGCKALRLELARSSDCEALAEAIRGGLTVPTRVEVLATSTANGDEPHWESDAVVILFESIGRLPRLQSVTLMGRGSVNNHFPLYLLRSILVPGRNRLRYLEVNFMQLRLGTFFQDATASTAGRSSSDDLLSLQQAFRQMTCLSQISFHCLAVFEGSVQTSAMFTGLTLETIAAQIPSLDCLTIVGKSEARALDFFGRPVPQREHLPLLSTTTSTTTHASFPTHTNLQELRLEHLNLPVALLHQIIQTQVLSTRLQVLVLGQIPSGTVIDKLSCCCNRGSTLLDHIETLLRDHPSLETFCLHGVPNGSYDRLLCQMANGVAHNSGALRELQLSSAHLKVTDRVQTAFVKALESNCSLQRIALGGDDDGNNNSDNHHRTVHSIPELNFYLKLNATMNRKHFVQNYATVPPNEWIRILARSYRDLDCLYYFLRLNPQLCFTQGNHIHNLQNCDLTMNKIRQVLTEKLPTTSLTDIDDIAWSLSSIMGTQQQQQQQQDGGGT